MGGSIPGSFVGRAFGYRVRRDGVLCRKCGKVKRERMSLLQRHALVRADDVSSLMGRHRSLGPAKLSSVGLINFKSLVTSPLP